MEGNLRRREMVGQIEGLFLHALCHQPLCYVSFLALVFSFIHIIFHIEVQ